LSVALVTTIRDVRIKGSLLALASWDKESQVNANGSGTLPSGKACLVSSRRRRRRSFANGSTWAGLVGLGTNLETVVNLRPAVAPVGWRATGRIGQVHCQIAGKEWGADLRLDSALRRWVASAATLTRLASSSSCMALKRSSILILTFSLASAAVRESM
jgi:hypothetical protein